MEYYDAGFAALWELDLFGRVRRGAEAAAADADAAAADLRDAQVLVAAEVARSYLRLARCAEAPARRAPRTSNFNAKR